MRATCATPPIFRNTREETNASSAFASNSSSVPSFLLASTCGPVGNPAFADMKSWVEPHPSVLTVSRNSCQQKRGCRPQLSTCAAICLKGRKRGLSVSGVDNYSRMEKANEVRSPSRHLHPSKQPFRQIWLLR